MIGPYKGAGVRAGDGVGGGKGWSSEAPYGRWRVTERLTGEVACTVDEASGGTINGEGAKSIGFKRFVAWLLLPGSAFSKNDIRGVDACGRAGDATGRTGVVIGALVLWEDEGVGKVEWLLLKEIPAELDPIFIALCK